MININSKGFKFLRVCSILMVLCSVFVLVINGSQIDENTSTITKYGITFEAKQKGNSITVTAIDLSQQETEVSYGSQWGSTNSKAELVLNDGNVEYTSSDFNAYITNHNNSITYTFDSNDNWSQLRIYISVFPFTNDVLTFNFN